MPPSDSSKGLAAIVFMCMDDRHNGQRVKRKLRKEFPNYERFFILTSAGGNYSPAYPEAVKTVLHAGYELGAVVHAKHKSCDCAAAAAGTRFTRAEAYGLVQVVNQEFDVNPQHFVANICTHTSEFTKIEPLDAERLTQAAA